MPANEEPSDALDTSLYAPLSIDTQSDLPDSFDKTGDGDVEDEELHDDENEESDAESTTEDQPQRGPIKLHIDMSSIPCIPTDQQFSELQELGVVAYEQQSYEKGVLKQVDDVINNQVTRAGADIHKKRIAAILSFENEPSPDESERESFDYQNQQPSTSAFGCTENAFNIASTKSQEVVQKVHDFHASRQHNPDDDYDDDGDEDVSKIRHKSFQRTEDNDEYIPSEEEREEYEDEEFENEKKRRKAEKKELLHKKMKLDSGPEKVTKKKIIDDGDEAAYQKRMRYVKLNAQQEASSGEVDVYQDFHIIGDDFKVPLHIWSKLYNYQQRGVQWLWELHQLGCGGILGDEMGLGKTIQVIAFLAGLSVSEVSNFRDERKKLGPVILVTPATVMQQWVSEFHAWWPFFRVAILHHTGSYIGKKKNLIRLINRSNGILITSYCSIVAYQDFLYDFDWHYVILDEGHKIRNPDAQTTIACKRFRTPHRIILSGSPIQNNLKELWSLFDFIYPGKLGTLPVFMEKFSVPITQGGYANASQIQVEIAYRCATVLRDAIKPYLLRRVKDEVQMALNLPSKNEQVLFCRLTDEQRDVYKGYLESNTIRDIFKGKTQIFVGLINLRKICNHPDLFTNGPKEETGDIKDTFGYYKRSGKMKVVDVLLSLWHKQGHKVLLFTQGKQMMAILEIFLRYREYAYLTMDGSSPIGSRQQTVKEFNSNPNIFVFLLTTKVGGVGLNLIGANRVLIYDPDWNPTTDMQARERAWRIGQDKQVTIYRLLTAGTVEEKIYHRQVFKQYLTNRVLKDPKQQRFFKTNNLHELFTLGNDSSATESSALFAGTGSKVNINKSAKNATKKDKSSKKSQILPPDKITLPPEKIKELHERAKKLSQMIGQKFANNSSSNSSNSSEFKSLISTSDSQLIRDSTNHLKNKSANSSASSSSYNKHNHDSNSIPTKNASKSKKHKGTVFEGKRIKYLVKSDTYNPVKDEKSEGDADLNKQQDDYVLKKLFKKSNMHSALQHDVIEGKTNSDFILIESEADKVANEAIKALRRSRQMCFAPSLGIPTWTGSSSTLPTASRFGKGRRDRLPGAASGSSDSAPSSASIIQSIRERNKFQTPEENEEDDNARPTPATSTISSEHNELLNDIRNFIAFQANVDGEATTQEILEKFKDRIPAQLTPIFKSLLWKISDFHRRSDGAGVWRIKGEFR